MKKFIEINENKIMNHEEIQIEDQENEESVAVEPKEVVKDSSNPRMRSHTYNETKKCYEENINPLYKSKGKIESFQRKYKATFFENLNNGELCLIEEDGTEVSFHYNDDLADDKSGKEIQKKRKFHRHNKSAKAEIENSNRVKYKRFIKHCDLEYIVESNRIKENIIVHKPLDSYEFGFTLKVKNLELILSEDKKSIVLQKTNTKKTIFTIPTPIMLDASNEESNDIIYEIEKASDHEYLFKVIADKEWINDSSRVFPVTIDPQIVSNSNDITMHDNVTGNPIFKKGKVGLFNGVEVSLWLKIFDIKSKIPEDKKITHAVLCLKKTSEVRSSVTKGFQARYNNIVFDTFSSGDNDGFIRIDLTRLIEEQDIAIHLRRDNAGTANDYIEIDESQSYLVMEYLYDNILDYDESLIKANLGHAGTTMVAMDTGEVLHRHVNIIGANCGLPINIEHNYRSKNQSRTKDTLIGNGWKLNIDQEIKKNVNNQTNKEEGIINTFEDGNGDIHEFIEKYFYVNDLGTKKFIKSSEITTKANGDEVFILDEKEYEVRRASFNQNGEILFADYHYDFETSIENILSENYEPEFEFYCDYAGARHELELDEKDTIELEVGKFTYNMSGETEHFEISLDKTFKQGDLEFYMFLGLYKVTVTRVKKSFAVHSRGSKKYITLITGIEKVIEPKSKMKKRISIPNGNFTNIIFRPPTDTGPNTPMYEYLINRPQGGFLSGDRYIYYTTELEIIRNGVEISKLLPMSYRTDKLLGLENQFVQINDAINETIYNTELLKQSENEFALKQLISNYEKMYNQISKELNRNILEQQKIISELSEAAFSKKLNSLGTVEEQKAFLNISKIKVNNYHDLINNSSAEDLDIIVAGLKFKLERESHISNIQLELFKFSIESLSKVLESSQIENQKAEFEKTRNMFDERLKNYREMRREVCQELLSLIEEYKKQPQDYIVLNSGMVLGFNYFGKLVDVGDSKESQIQINYEDNVLVSLQMKDKAQVGFFYKDGELVYIKDPRGRIISFEYEKNHQLKKIIYPDLSETLFTYLDTDDSGSVNQKRLLSEVINQNGTKTQLTYEDKKVTNIKIVPYSDTVDLPLEFNKTIFRSGTGTVKIIDEITSKRTNYIIDIIGRVVTTYEDQTELMTLDKLKGVKSINHNYIGKKIRCTIKPKSEYIGNVTKNGFENSASTGNNGLVNWSNTGAELVDSHFVEGAQCAKLTGNPIGDKYVGCTFRMTKMPENGMLVISMWAKAKSLTMLSNLTSNEEDWTCQEINPDNYDSHKRKRRFGIRVNVYYNDKVTDIVEQQYDYHNEDWQLGIIPIKIKPGYELSQIKFEIYGIYNFNLGEVYFDNVQLNECEYRLEEKDDEGRLILVEDGEYQITYEEFDYKNPRRIVKTSIKNPSKQYITESMYNQQNQLVWTQDYTGMITENKYDEEGNLLLTKTYHKNEPTAAFISEYHHDELGRTSKDVDARGDESGKELSTKYAYLDTSEIISSIEDNLGNKVFYGYDYHNDNLLSISSSVNGVKNNVLRTYKNGAITKLTQNNTEYEYKYDGLNRLLEFKIADKVYVTNEYKRENELNIVTSINGNNEVVMTEATLTGDAVKTYQMMDGVKTLISEYQKIDDDSFTINEPRIGHSVQGSKYRVKYLKGTTVIIDKETSSGDILDKTKYTLNINGETITRETEYYYNDEYEHKLQEIIFKEQNQVQRIKNDNLNRLVHTEVQSNNKVLLSISYDYLQAGDHATNLVKSIKTKTPTSNQHTHYTYNGNGNISTITSKGEIKQRFRYDSLNRLTREDNKELNISITFEYDISGNITAKTEHAFTLSEDLDTGVRHEYEYGDEWKDQLQSYDGEACIYDNIGNPIKYRNQILVWKSGRQLICFRDIEFKYSSNGIRYEKVSNGVTTTYYLDGSTIISEKRGSDVLVYQYGVNGICGFSYNGNDYIYEKNLQGDIVGLYNASGEICARYVYDGYGQVRVHNIIGNIGDINPFRYRSYYYDEETGLYYLQSRYYDPEIGRFINADDISYLDSESINGLNLYAYCGNNPVMNVDPSGHFFISALIIGALVGVAIGGGFSIGSQLIASKGDWSQINWMQVGLDAAIGGISGLVAATGIGVLGSAIFGGVLGFGGSIGGDLIASKGDWSQINWGKAIIMGVVGAGIGALCGSGAQNVDDLGRELMNNSSIKSQFTRLVDAVDNYAVGAISKRGMQGVFNIYGGQFVRSVTSALPRLVAKNLALNLLKLTGATIATIGINYGYGMIF